jgi:DNA-binding protein H-NS
VKFPCEKAYFEPCRLRFRVFLSEAEWANIAAHSESELYLLDWEKVAMALKTMPIAKLQALKSQVEAAISAKVTQRRRELETELAKLAGHSGGNAAKYGRGGRMGSVAPKYRNPENPAETWAGRGLKPGWLTAAIRGGKTLEDFLIPGAVTRA